MKHILLLLSATIFLELITGISAHGETQANGGQSSGKQQDLRYSCQVAGAFRQTLNSMTCNCKASQSCDGGPLPNDTGTCASPSDTQNTSGKTGLDYQLGARPSLKNKVSFPANKIDCSGFVSAGLCRAGIPFIPGKPCQDMTTKTMVDAIEKGKSCFEPVQAGSQPNLQGGEIVVYAEGGIKKGVGHTFAIDRVGQSCEDVSIIQSSGKKKGVGISKLGGKGGTSDVMGMAQEEVKKINCGAANAKESKIKVVRFNPNKSGCQEIKPTPLAKEDCVKQCDVGRMMDRGA